MSKQPTVARNVGSLVAAAEKKPSPVYLLAGEPPRTEEAAHALIDVLVPPERRGFNLEMYDGRTAAVGPILDSLRTPGFFAGYKVVWIREPAFLQAGAKRSDVAADLFAACEQSRSTAAGAALLRLAALAGWSQERFAETDWASVSQNEAKKLLGRSVDDQERGELASVRAHCLARNLTVGEFREEAGLVEEVLDGGLPAQSVLILSAAVVDRRKRLAKRIGALGTVAEFTVERERSGALTAAAADEIVAGVMKRNGKRLDAAARRLVRRRAGSDMAAFLSELEKLCLYVGDASEIGEHDVRACCRDLGESWIFDFTRALAQRQCAQALGLLRGLFAQGEHPLRLMGMIARELRLLLLARDCLEGDLATKWNPRVTYNSFRDRLLPEIGEEQREAFGKMHPYALYLALQNADRVSTAVLQRGITGLHELDLKLKTSLGDPRIQLESLVIDLTG